MNLHGMIAQMQMGQPGAVGPAGMDQTAEPVKAASKAPGDPATHLKAAHSAAKSGDHKKAKHHAFAAIKAMPRAAAPAAPAAAPAAAV